jgi:hypothetical protein
MLLFPKTTCSINVSLFAPKRVHSQVGIDKSLHLVAHILFDATQTTKAETAGYSRRIIDFPNLSPAWATLTTATEQRERNAI